MSLAFPPQIQAQAMAILVGRQSNVQIAELLRESSSPSIKQPPANNFH